MSKIIKSVIPEKCKTCARHFIGLQGAEWEAEREEFCGCWTNMCNIKKDGSPWITASDAMKGYCYFKCDPIPRRYAVEEYNETACTKVTFWNELEEAKYYAHDCHYSRVVDTREQKIVASFGELKNESILIPISRYAA